MNRVDFFKQEHLEPIKSTRVILKEADDDRFETLTISHLPKNAIVFKPLLNTGLKNHLPIGIETSTDKTKSVGCCADYLIFIPNELDENQIDVLGFELKEGEIKKAIKQLVGAYYQALKIAYFTSQNEILTDDLPKNLVINYKAFLVRPSNKISTTGNNTSISRAKIPIHTVGFGRITLNELIRYLGSVRVEIEVS